jgi:penicillin-binding protein 1A
MASRRKRTQKRGQKRRRKDAPRRSRLGIVLRILLVGTLLLVGAAAAGLAWLWPRCSGDDCPSVHALRTYTPPQATRVYDSEGRLLAHLAPERRILVDIEDVPEHVTGAFLAVEDRRFYEHAGIDTRRIGGAVVSNVRNLRFAEGFSTITMQLARNVFPDHLTRDKTLSRKLWEVVIARRIEDAFSKDEILEMYLNQIYLGEGLYGVEAAAQGYFGRPVTELTVTEAAQLAALPRAPSFYSPRRNPVPAVRRRNLVLGMMGRAAMLSEAEVREAQAAPLALAPPIEAGGEAPYFVAMVREELRERFGPDAERAGLRVYTTLDRELQRSAERRLREQLASVEAGELGRWGHGPCGDDPTACLQGLMVAIRPANGDIAALVGGRDFARSQFNRVTLARRQSGSAFKPFVYAAGLQAGVPISTALSGPYAAALAGDYRPADHVADSVHVDMRTGMRLSSNRAAVALGERVGAPRVVQTARDMGLTTPMQEYPSTFLGAADVVPLELVAAFTAFANLGTRVTPRAILRIENRRGEVVHRADVARHQVLPVGAAYLTLDLMRDAIDTGTGSAVRSVGLPASVPAAGKTGTTNEAADVWFVGATPDLVAGVWMGFDRPRRIMHGASGGRLVAPVWGRVMADYYRTRPAPAPWRAPTDLVRVRIDRQSGELAGPRCPEEYVGEEWFIAGTEPTVQCTLHPEPSLEGWFRRAVRGIGEVLGGGGD